MQVDFRIKDFRFTGGVLIILDYARYLSSRGHSIRILWEGKGSQDLRTRAGWIPVVAVDGLAQDDHADITVFTFPQHTRQVASWRTTPVFFCQGQWWKELELKIEAARGLRGFFRGWRTRRKLADYEVALSHPMPKVATTGAIADYLERFPGKVYLVPVGVDLGRFCPPAPTSRCGRTVLLVGATSLRVKRVEDALRAMKILKARRPDLKVLRLSTEPMEDFERSLGITDEYYEKIAPDEVAGLYKRADAAVIVSGEAEGFNLPAIEAMASGTPTVLSRAGCFLGYDKRTDYAEFVDIGDIEGIADAVDKVIGDEALRGHLRQRGLEVARKYDIAGARRRFEEVMREILNQRN